MQESSKRLLCDAYGSLHYSLVVAFFFNAFGWVKQGLGTQMVLADQ
ncbi:hypothetical protein AF72_06840 [Xylella taiwanensis]|uniref:Uncharacterized protein n=1 Tax=Xylella taiwanensis TaxID=1444770 RepID=Z9JJ61_9GAMM|nr:hypothetical protein AF72_06840 [Xylella taiwanensis]